MTFAKNGHVWSAKNLPERNESTFRQNIGNSCSSNGNKTLATQYAPPPWRIAVEMMHIATNTISTQLHQSYRYFFQPPQQSHNKILDTSPKIDIFWCGGARVCGAGEWVCGSARRVCGRARGVQCFVACAGVRRRAPVCGSTRGCAAALREGCGSS